jgi:hypothetical protein
MRVRESFQSVEEEAAMSIGDPKIQELLDEYALRRLVTLYSRAIDRRDMDLIRTLYHPDAIDDHGLFSGTIGEFIDHLGDTAQIMTYSMHNITHSVFEIAGKRAAGESYFIAYHHFMGGYEPVSRFFGPSYADARVADGTIEGPQLYVCGGRYIDRFEKRDDEWRIGYRRITNEWNICQPDRTINDEGVLAKLNLPGKRDRDDPIYAAIAGLETYDDPWL